MAQTNERTIDAAKVSNFAQVIFEKLGLAPTDAQMVVNSLIAADLRGVNSHGVLRIPIYASRVVHGVVSAKPNIVVERDDGATAVLNANNTFGQIAATMAMELAMKKAKMYGIGCVGVCQSHHYGTAGYFAQMAADKNMIGISMSNTSPSMMPPGGQKNMVGNNPISFSVPAGGYPPIVFDMATSAVAQGKIQLAAKRNVPLQPGWALDKNGKPTTDPLEGLTGSLCPVGGPKGYGLALIIDIMSGILTGAGFGAGVSALTNVFDRTQNCGHLLIAIDIEKFVDLVSFKKNVDIYIRNLKESPRAEGVDEIFVPGEIEENCRKKRLVEGIPLPETVITDLRNLANELEIDASQYL